MQQANQPSSTEVHIEKPLPVRQRHFRKPARDMRPAVVVKAMKKTTIKKKEKALINRVATGLAQQRGGVGRPVREKKGRRDWAVSQPACPLVQLALVVDFASVVNTSCGTLSYTVNDHKRFKDIAAIWHEH